jgi:hypothetical protein
LRVKYSPLRTEGTTQEAFEADHPGAAIFARETDDGAILLAAWPDRLVVAMQGAIHSSHLIEALREMRAAGLPATDEFTALIDISTFTGEIDWRDIWEVREVMPKGDSRTNKNAYVVRNPLFALVAKITSVLFPQTQNAAFPTQAEARQWLGWEISGTARTTHNLPPR